jgi:sec-independent protein translocase protein TatB
MFDFAWSEIAVIGVVALIAIGPKDLPGALKAITGFIKRARRMAGEFQTHVDEMMREADLSEVRQQINEIRNFDFKGHTERAIDPDGSLRSEFATGFAPPAAQPVAGHGTQVMERPPEADLAPRFTPQPSAEAPAFIPPRIANPMKRPPFVPPDAPEPHC